MRWEIKTKSSVEKIDDTRSKKITKVVRSQYITVGDIVGMGKSAAGAVQKLAENLPGFISQMKNNPASQTKAISVNSIVQPLSVILSGMDVFKKVIGVIDVLTPIMKTVARGTGVWCSPGNVADIAQILLGTTQQIAISILSSAILRLKERIWNVEFNILNIPEPDKIYIITNHLKNRNNDIILDSNIYNESDNVLNSDSESSSGSTSLSGSEQLMNEILKEVEKNYTDEESKVKIELENVLNSLGNKEESTNDKISRQSSYITEYISKGATHKRLLSGARDNKGIYYSDDNGLTWNETALKEGSFICFAKIKNGSGYTYVAGSNEIIKSIKKTEDKEINKRKNYYDKDKKRLSRYQKETTDIDFLYEADEVEAGKGIWYSDDNGLTWSKSSLKEGSFELLYEFNDPNNESDVPTIVASSFDYKGVYFTEDGISWYYSKYNGEDINDKWIVLRDLNNYIVEIIPNDLNFKTEIISSNVNPLVTLEANMEQKVHLIPKIYPGKGFEDIDEYDGRVREILNYIHINKEVAKYDLTFWDDLINKIIRNEYTIEDAMSGKGL